LQAKSRLRVTYDLNYENGDLDVYIYFLDSGSSSPCSTDDGDLDDTVLLHEQLVEAFYFEQCIPCAFIQASTNLYMCSII